MKDLQLLLNQTQKVGLQRAFEKLGSLSSKANSNASVTKFQRLRHRHVTTTGVRRHQRPGRSTIAENVTRHPRDRPRHQRGKASTDTLSTMTRRTRSSARGDTTSRSAAWRSAVALARW
ncbi:hypothetical protein ACFX13_031765 [Malus domestica]